MFAFVHPNPLIRMPEAVSSTGLNIQAVRTDSIIHVFAAHSPGTETSHRKLWSDWERWRSMHVVPGSNSNPLPVMRPPSSYLVSSHCLSIFIAKQRNLNPMISKASCPSMERLWRTFRVWKVLFWYAGNLFVCFYLLEEFLWKRYLY